MLLGVELTVVGIITVPVFGFLGTIILTFIGIVLTAGGFVMD